MIVHNVGVLAVEAQACRVVILEPVLLDKSARLRCWPLLIQRCPVPTALRDLLLLEESLVEPLWPDVFADFPAQWVIVTLTLRLQAQHVPHLAVLGGDQS